MARGWSSKSATGTDQTLEEKPLARTTAMPSVKDSTTQENPLKRTISLILIIHTTYQRKPEKSRKMFNYFLARSYYRASARTLTRWLLGVYQTKQPPGLACRPTASGWSSKSVTGTDQTLEEKPLARTTAESSVKDSTTQENPLKRTISLILIIPTT